MSVWLPLIKPRKSRAKWRKVNSKRNSSCAFPLERLNWSHWWTNPMKIDLLDEYQDDFSTTHHHRVKSYMYLLVEADDGTVQRVYCKHADVPRVGVRRGTLCWLIDCTVQPEEGV
jgi:hypothetical protein